MRTLVRELRPASVADAGLLSFLKSHAALRERRDELRVTLAVEGEETGDPGVKELLFRTAREALNNVVRHAGVCEARLELAFGAAEATLRVIDEGTGFDPAAARRPESYGLLAMRERVEAQGGTLLVRSSPGAGTAVEVRVPLHPEGEKK